MKIDKDDPLGLLKGKAPSDDDPLGLLGDDRLVTKKDISEITEWPLVSGIGKGMYDVGRGIYQRGLEAGSLLTGPSKELAEGAERAGIPLPQTPMQERLDQFKRGLSEEKAVLDPYTKESTRFKVGEILGETAATAPIPGGVSGGLGARALSSLAAGGITGFLKPTTGKESVSSNIFWGGVGGAAAPLILAPAGKGFNILKGEVASKYKQAMELSEQHGVPLTVGEIAQNPLVQRMEKYLEYVPWVGINRFRRMQGEATEDLAKRTMGRYGSGTISQAQQEMQQGLIQGLERAKNKVDAAYRTVAAEIQAHGGDGVGVANTRNEVLNMLQEYPEIFKRLDDTKLEGKLRIIAGGTAPTVQPSSLVNAQGQSLAPTIIPKEITFQNYDWIRKRLGVAIDKAYKKQGVGEVGSEEVNFLTQIKKQLDLDAEEWGRAHPNSRVVELTERARAIYKNEVVPYKDTLINEALNIHYDTDQMFKAFVKPDRVLLAGKMIANMEPQGVEATKYAILKTAYDAASPEKTGLKVFSPNTFANKIKKYSDVNKEIFTSRELDELKGISNLMTYAGAAGQRLADPPTGQRMGPLLTGGALWELSGQIAPAFGGGTGGRAAGIGAGLGLVEAITLSLTTPIGRKLLLTASKIEPTHPAMKKVFERIYNLSAKAGANIANREEAE